MNVIFLDFNGVLDTYEEMNIINKDNLLRLKKIVDETDSKVVITSSLKNNSYKEGKYTSNLIDIFINPLKEVGIEVIGITPNKETREDEITEYLINNPNIDNFLILDDEFTYEKYKNNFIKLEFLGNGLEDKNIDQAIKILKRHFD